jgi:alkylresorcinol/alkylpyrone synthase
MKTVLRSVATANPPLYVTQEEAFRVFEQRFKISARELDLYRKILLDGPIRGRFVGMNSTAEAVEDDQDKLVARFTEFGRATAAAAAGKALTKAGVKPGGVAAVVVNTCTGYLCPGLSSYLAETLGLSPSVRPLDIMGMGCGAALPNLETAANMAAARPGQPVLSVAVEICSATLFMDADPGVVVSNCIFGDGAAAAVIEHTPESRNGEILRLLDFESGLFPEHREKLKYRTEKHRLRNVLEREVPVIGARAIDTVARRLLKRRKLAIDDIDWWIVHAGGTQVLDRVGRQMGIPGDRLKFSRDIFAEYGNMSSPTVLFVLERILAQGRPREGDRGLILSFGAGFSAFAALVEFQG